MGIALFDISFFKRLKIVRKILFRKFPYLIIPNKPEGMIIPRGPEYIISPVKEIIDRQMDAIGDVVERLQPYMKQYLGLVENGVLDESGGHFGGGDGASTYAMVRHFKPKKIIEIGCGQSTRVMREALDEVFRETSQKGDLECVDPMPRKNIEGITDNIFYKSILEVDSKIFASLDDGDFLFIDGSHYSFNGTDATYLFLEVLPRLKKGVIVHVHDIFLPFEYPIEFSRRLYNEQYLLAVTIMNEQAWKILLPVYAVAQDGDLLMGLSGGSFWFSRR